MMCLESQLASSKRELAKKVKHKRVNKATHGITRCPAHDEMSEQTDLLSEFVEDQLTCQAIELEERAKRKDATTLEKLWFSVADNKPLIVLLLLFFFGEKIIPILLK